MTVKTERERFIYSSCLINNEALRKKKYSVLNQSHQNKPFEVEHMIVAISKGQQITIPASIRESLGLTVGSKIDIEESRGKIIIKPVGEDLKSLFEKAKKIKPKMHLTAEQMDKLVEGGIK